MDHTALWIIFTECEYVGMCASFTCRVSVWGIGINSLHFPENPLLRITSLSLMMKITL